MLVTHHTLSLQFFPCFYLFNSITSVFSGEWWRWWVDFNEDSMYCVWSASLPKTQVRNLNVVKLLCSQIISIMESTQIGRSEFVGALIDLQFYPCMTIYAWIPVIIVQESFWSTNFVPMKFPNSDNPQKVLLWGWIICCILCFSVSYMFEMCISRLLFFIYIF